MIDIKFIRENPEDFDKIMSNRSNKIRASEILTIDENNREQANKIQELQSQRNQIAKEVAKLKQANTNQESIEKILENSRLINQQLQALEGKYQEDNLKLQEIINFIPNLLDDSVPIGKDENDNKIIASYGNIRSFNFTINDHITIGEKLGMLDFEQSAIISGARFSTLTGDFARLERAISNFMLDVATEFGYQEFSPPNLVNSESMFRSGQLPKFAEEAFKTTDDYWLIPTSEVSLVNFFAKRIVSEKELPIRLTAYTPCFRREAGSAGKDTRGMIRQHQFKKVELISLVKPENSMQEHEFMTNIACEILRRLELPFRKILLCSGDIGFAANKTYDLEVWLPSQNQYREISSCSNCGDFQSRRLQARYKDSATNKNHLLHTLNGSALAVGRTLVAIIENYQNSDYSITIPSILQPYFGKSRIELK
jgi:seryl-tRNA synthetase